jgi:hypothetical protein
MSTRSVEAHGLSEAWIAAVVSLLHSPGHEANHLFVRITEPLPENEEIRAQVDLFAKAGGLQPVDEVRNTIFPAALAEDLAQPSELIAEYLEEYDVVKRLGSPQGTYFGRICEFPHPDGTTTRQLEVIVAKLRDARANQLWRAIYQLNIFAEHKDQNKKRNFFPCMAHLAFQLSPHETDPRLDCVALYRYQDLVLKGYGNYLGIAELQRYVADATGFAMGELSVLAGHAGLTLAAGSKTKLEDLVSEISP